MVLEMVLAHAGDNELIVPFILIIGLLLILRGGDPKPDDEPSSQDAHEDRSVSRSRREQP